VIGAMDEQPINGYFQLPQCQLLGVNAKETVMGHGFSMLLLDPLATQC
jgi:hypothetical protein